MAGFAARALKRGEEKKGTRGFASSAVNYGKMKVTEKAIKDSFEKVKNKIVSKNEKKQSFTDKISNALQKVGKQKVTKSDKKESLMDKIGNAIKNIIR